METETRVAPVGFEDGARARLWAARWERFRAWLRPLGSGPGEIAALDGLRALAALSVLFYHASSIAGAKLIVGGADLTWTYFYTESGVDLFFVLSGFLLFLPYARASLLGRAAPGARSFYARRARRILPGYYVCLAVLTVAQPAISGSVVSAWNVVFHGALLHDMVPAYNRTISGPFWTLAVEWQFYLMLPLMTWVIGRFGARSPRRLVVGVLGVIAVAIGLREVDALLTVARGSLGSALPWVDLAQRVVIGSQGKYLEVFGVGMLCATFYVWAGQRREMAAAADDAGAALRLGRLTRRAGWALLALALVTYLVMGPLVMERRNAILAAFYLALRPADVQMLVGPLGLGVGYGALTLGTLWGPRAVRAVFEWWPLRFVGLVSYSLYLWHEAILGAVYPRAMALVEHVAPGQPWVGTLRFPVALLVGLCVGISFAYVAYQLVERPFLRRAQPRPAATDTLAQETRALAETPAP